LSLLTVFTLLQSCELRAAERFQLLFGSSTAGVAAGEALAAAGSVANFH